VALERKDVRAAVDDEVHKALVIFARHAGCTVAEYVENLIQADVSAKVSVTIEHYHELAKAGIVGKTPDLFGKPKAGA
jgi:hypothetical protein